MDNHNESNINGITNEIAFIIANRLKELRSSYNYTVKQVAEKIKCSPDIINAYEAGGIENHSKANKLKGMSIDKLLRFAELYDVSTDYLLGKSDVSNPQIDYQGAARKFGLTEYSLELLEHCKQAADNAKNQLLLISINAFLETPYFYEFCLLSVQNSIKLEIANRNRLSKDEKYFLNNSVLHPKNHISFLSERDSVNEEINRMRYKQSKQTELLVHSVLRNESLSDLIDDYIEETTVMSEEQNDKSDITDSGSYMALKNITDKLFEYVRMECLSDPIGEALIAINNAFKSDNNANEFDIFSFRGILAYIAYDLKSDDILSDVGSFLRFFIGKDDYGSIANLSLILENSEENLTIARIKEFCKRYMNEP